METLGKPTWTNRNARKFYGSPPTQRQLSLVKKTVNGYLISRGQIFSQNFPQLGDRASSLRLVFYLRHLNVAGCLEILSVKCCHAWMAISLILFKYYNSWFVILTLLLFLFSFFASGHFLSSTEESSYDRKHLAFICHFVIHVS